MRNFHRIGSNVAVGQLAHALVRHPELWNQHRFRTQFPRTPHVDVDDIWLRFSKPERLRVESVIEDEAPIWYPAAMVLREVKPIALEIMNWVGAYELGRMLITRVRPGGRILRHADNTGDYALDPDIARYHVVVQGAAGSMFHCGNESVQMSTGEVWWFNAREEHEVLNNSEDDRIHLLIDVRTWPCSLSP